MVHLTWKLFSQTGNIETYLLLKEMEKQQNEDKTYTEMDKQDISSLDPK
ncbi:MAG TPA: YqzL family protein [Bacillota bacterium]|nr:YqzL family protein [Bacillota bacterium]